MRSRLSTALFALLGCYAASSTPIWAEDDGSNVHTRNGEKQWATFCASCHGGAMLEAPQIAALKLYSPARIITALTSGVMSTAGLPLSRQDIRDVALYLTGEQPSAKRTDLSHAYCTDTSTRSSPEATNPWTGWGGNASNTRFQHREATLTPTNVQGLQLDWAFAFPETTRMRAQPVVAGDTLYIGSQSGTVYALDRDSGCIRWTFQADAEVRGAVNLQTSPDSSTSRILFGDFKANAYALDATDGSLQWKVKVHEHPMATITGSVTADTDTLYVPVSSSEVVPAAQKDYVCCTFRGAVTAVNLVDGSIKWRYYTTDVPTDRGKTSVGTQRLGPSGAPVWSAPTLDTKRAAVIITTGQNYSSPATGTSDAVIALDAQSGKPRWIRQVTANDAWNGACSRKTPNCPEEDGPDFDIGAAAILVSREDEDDLVLAGQKSGLTYGINAATGALLWTTRVGSGGTMGGVHWGMSSDGQKLYVGVSDLPTRNPYAIESEAFPGVHALNPDTGEFFWRTSVPNQCPQDTPFYCHNGVSAALSSSPGLVYAGGLDGMFRILDARNGEVLWEYATAKNFTSLTGVSGRGGAIESDGPVVSGGRIFVTSGYDKWAEAPGNVLLSFSLKPRPADSQPSVN